MKADGVLLWNGTGVRPELTRCQRERCWPPKAAPITRRRSETSRSGFLATVCFRAPGTIG